MPPAWRAVDSATRPKPASAPTGRRPSVRTGISAVSSPETVSRVHSMARGRAAANALQSGMTTSIQDEFYAQGICFGCGPRNERGLRIKSRVLGDEVVADWTPEEHHQAWPGMLNGGITGALLDCHSNWTAAWHLMQRDGLDRPPCTVTAEFHVKLRRPTPVDGPVRLRARVAEASGPRVTIDATLEAAGQVTATCRGVFVAVEEGHPAFHRW